MEHAFGVWHALGLDSFSSNAQSPAPRQNLRFQLSETAIAHLEELKHAIDAAELLSPHDTFRAEKKQGISVSEVVAAERTLLALLREITTASHADPTTRYAFSGLPVWNEVVEYTVRRSAALENT
jgi:hypothetical protein